MWFILFFFYFKLETDEFFLCSFAGGKQDPSDRNVVETALREAREELGINVTENEVWGVLKPLNDAVSWNFWAQTTKVCNMTS